MNNKVGQKQEGKEKETHFEDIQNDDRPGAGQVLVTHARQPAIEARLVPSHDPARAEEAHDARARVKGAEHDGAPPVLLHVGDGLDAGTGGVHVGAEVRVEDAKGRRRQALGRDVDVSSLQGGRGHEEDLLLHGPLGQVWLDLVVELDHFRTTKGRV